MPKSFRTCFLLAVFLTALPTHQSFGSTYLSVKAGKATPNKIYDETRYNFAQFDFKSGTNISIAAGKNTGSFKFEMEISHRELESGELYNPSIGIEKLSGHASQTGLLLTGYYTFYDNPVISANIGAGLGNTWIEWNNVASASTTTINDSNDVTTYKLGIAIDIKINKDYSVVVDYSMLYMDDLIIKDGNGTTGTINHQDINMFNVGLIYSF